MSDAEPCGDEQADVPRGTIRRIGDRGTLDNQKLKRIEANPFILEDGVLPVCIAILASIPPPFLTRGQCTGHAANPIAS